MCSSLSRASLGSFFFNVSPTAGIYTLSLHDALPIYFGGATSERRSSSWPSRRPPAFARCSRTRELAGCVWPSVRARRRSRSEEHTSELQSHVKLVCRLLLEKKKKVCDHVKGIAIVID